MVVDMTLPPEVLAKIEEIEEWAAIPGWDGFYEASSLGRIRSYLPQGSGARDRLLAEPHIKAQVLNPEHGYLYVGLGRRTNGSVHRLILLAFRGLPREGEEGSHLNGIKTDNRLSNLIWEPRPDNMKRKWGHGTQTVGHEANAAKVTEEMVAEMRALRTSGWSYRLLSLRYGLSERTTSAAVTGKTWKHVPNPCPAFVLKFPNNQAARDSTVTLAREELERGERNG